MAMKLFGKQMFLGVSGKTKKMFVVQVCSILLAGIITNPKLQQGTKGHY